MGKEDEREQHPKDDAEGGSTPWPLLVMAWLVPGVGHLVLGRKVRAAVFASVIVAATITGLLLKGELAMPRPGAPFSWLAFLACLGNGGLFMLGKLLGLGHGDVTYAGFGYGNTFLITAGLMNLLTVLDVSDIAKGAKS